MTGILEQFLQFFTLSHIMAIIYALNALIALGLIFFDDSKSPSATMDNGAVYGTGCGTVPVSDLFPAYRQTADLQND